MIHTITITNYRPPRTNELYRGRFCKRMAQERECAQFIAHYGRDLPKATGKRRVSLSVTLARRQRLPDADEQSLKAVLDGLVRAELLRGDSRQWCECRPTEFVLSQQPRPQTVITLEDVDDG